MGITIHYSFVKEQEPTELLKRAEQLAVKLGWKVLESKKNSLIVHPHEDSESVDLTFKKLKVVKKIDGYDYIKNILDDFRFDPKYDNDLWVCTAFCKTQYAGAVVHVKVAEFLRTIAGFCNLSKVNDESDYYEKGFSEKSIIETRESFDESSKMLGNLAGQLKETFGKDNIICGGDL